MTAIFYAVDGEFSNVVRALARASAHVDHCEEDNAHTPLIRLGELKSPLFVQKTGLVDQWLMGRVAYIKQCIECQINPFWDAFYQLLTQLKLWSSWLGNINN